MNLRRIASALAFRSGVSVLPVSLLHSSKVAPSELGGVAAETLEAALRRRLEGGEQSFLLLPLFFGPSRALTEYLPKRLAALRKVYPEMKVRVAPCLFDPALGTDFRLASILRDRVEALLQPGPAPAVVVVDHGSPAPEVAYVRDFVGGQLSVLLEGRVSRLAAASMERRPGDEYRFCDPLLEDLLNWDGFNRGRVIVAMMFLSPGRHAGPGGDVREICRRAERANPGLRVEMSGLAGDHPLLLSILEDRVRQGLQGFPGATAAESERRGPGAG